MKYSMKNISLFTCSVMASIVVLTACAQTTVSVRTTTEANDQAPARRPASAARQYEPISRSEPYTVQAGDTLYGISFRAGLSYREVAAWNAISEPYTVKIGQRLVLQAPGGNETTETNVAATNTKPVEAKPVETIKPVEGKPVIKPPVSVAETPQTTSAVPTKPVATTPAINTTEKPVLVPEIKPAINPGTMNWRWPSDGTLIARFVAGDPTQQGINIAGSSGQPVRASADGTVVYSGAGLVGYGELIIIKHNNEWLSAYAHNRRRLVAEGTKVKAGDVIAEMGRTGTMRDMLHFEIRRNGKPVDPMQFLPKQ